MTICLRRYNYRKKRWGAITDKKTTAIEALLYTFYDLLFTV